MKYIKQFEKFVAEARLIEDAENAKYELTAEESNLVELTGEITGRDTHDKIIELGRQHGLIVLAYDLAVGYRE